VPFAMRPGRTSSGSSRRESCRISSPPTAIRGAHAGDRLLGEGGDSVRHRGGAGVRSVPLHTHHRPAFGDGRARASHARDGRASDVRTRRARLLRGARYYTFNNFRTDSNANIDPAATWDDSSAQPHWRNRSQGVPFFGQFTGLTTHEATIYTARPGPTSVDAVTIPHFYPDTPTTHRRRQQTPPAACCRPRKREAFRPSNTHQAAARGQSR
jgi:hypothetical protein